MQLNLKFSVKDFIKFIPKPNPNSNLKAKPTPAPTPNPNPNVVDNQLNIIRKFENDLSICRASIGDHPNKVSPLNVMSIMSITKIVINQPKNSI